MAKKQCKIDEDDFNTLDRFARSITPEQMRPLSAKMRREWELVKRGRPRKPAGAKAVPTLITVDPKLLKAIDAYAKKNGLSRSQLFAEAVRKRIRA